MPSRTGDGSGAGEDGLGEVGTTALGDDGAADPASSAEAHPPGAMT